MPKRKLEECDPESEELQKIVGYDSVQSAAESDCATDLVLSSDDQKRQRAGKSVEYVSGVEICDETSDSSSCTTEGSTETSTRTISSLKKCEILGVGGWSC